MTNNPSGYAGFMCASPHCPGEHTSPYYRCDEREDVSVIADERDRLRAENAELRGVLEQLKPHLSVALQSLAFHVAMAAYGWHESAFDEEREEAIEAIRPYTKYAPNSSALRASASGEGV